jgi:hypothetical protein
MIQSQQEVGMQFNLKDGMQCLLKSEIEPLLAFGMYSVKPIPEYLKGTSLLNSSPFNKIGCFYTMGTEYHSVV